MDSLSTEVNKGGRFQIDYQSCIEENNQKVTTKLSASRAIPALITVVGDPKKSGMDTFVEEGAMGYQAACAAAIQYMHLAAHAFGLGSLWFTLFDKKS